MKILNSFILFFVSVIICANVHAGTSTPKRYPKSFSGIINYEISGSTITGTEVVYYDDWGRREAIYTKTTMDLAGVTVDRYTLTILEENGQWINTIDLNARTGMRMRNPRYKDYVGKSSRELEKITKNNLIDAGAHKAEFEWIAGKTCVVWEKKYTSVKTCTWNGIILKKITGTGFSRITKVATEIKEHVTIPEEKFTIPPDIEMKTVNISTLHGN
ncbi:phosphotransferase system, mannose/fructose-specific component IIA [Candidatus Scalindua japonica]|uniref:Phosphotransferase system, mannose/fructose-specific component IIA n=1 Tax=Candidatus Scalindua japonica TaxID=1284222 RepID=A0A286U2G2_9BACT|nr:hypothetical protein [Candidatus Scalindua japonica]GAX62316.1 phosphotransferase system, mannose/fructose-specific component IIA [Candidatus Scalindua japonica]